MLNARRTGSSIARHQKHQDTTPSHLASHLRRTSAYFLLSYATGPTYSSPISTAFRLYLSPLLSPPHVLPPPKIRPLPPLASIPRRIHAHQRACEAPAHHLARRVRKHFSLLTSFPPYRKGKVRYVDGREFQRKGCILEMWRDRERERGEGGERGLGCEAEVGGKVGRRGVAWEEGEAKTGVVVLVEVIQCWNRKVNGRGLGTYLGEE